MRFIRMLLGIFTSLAATITLGQMPDGEYLDGKTSKAAVILAHGRGLGPDGNVVGPLRRTIHEELGFHTLSLQMPPVASEESLEAPEVVSAFPEAYRRIQAGIDFLKKEKGVERIYLMGHSMGGRMTTGFLADRPNAGISGFIGVGLLGGGKEPVNPNLNLRRISVAVIDVYAENDRDAKAAEFRKPFVSARYVQVPVPGAKHDYRGYERPVAAAVTEWLKKQEAK